MYKDKVVIVTGGSRGIGYQVVEKLLAQGAKVCFWSNKVETGKAAMEKLMAINPEYPVMTANPCLYNFDEVNAVVGSVVEKWGKIDALFCNAGVSSMGMPVTRQTEEEWDYVMNVNVKGTFMPIKAVAAYMKKQKFGAIVCTASVTGTQGSAMGLPYPASKHAVVGMVRSLSMELAYANIRVNAVCPGVVDTDMVAQMPEMARKQVEGSIPFKRFAKPEEIADALLYLGSDAACYITGDIMEVLGGYKSLVPNLG